MKKIFALFLCLMVLCTSGAFAAVPTCDHSSYSVLETWQEIERREDGHEYIVYQRIYCHLCQKIIEEYIANSHLEGHEYNPPEQVHDYDENCDIVTYTCYVCGHRAIRYVPCLKPPCKLIYWSLRP